MTEPDDYPPRSVTPIVLTVLAVMIACSMCALWGLSDSGLDEFEEDQAREAGVSRPCYEAIRDSLVWNGEQAVYHEDVVRTAQAIRRDSAAWPRDRWFRDSTDSTHTCP